MKILGTLILILSAAPWTCALAQSRPLAMVEKVQGSVMVRRAGARKFNEIKGSKFRSLQKGDTVKTGQNSQAIVYQAYTRVYTLPANQIKLIHEPTPRKGDDILTLKDFNSYYVILIASAENAGKESEGVLRGSEDTVITAFSPRFSFELNAHPIFSWTPVPAKESYEVVLYSLSDAQHAKELWRVTTSEIRIAYPAERAALAPGRYKWQVTAKVGDEYGIDAAPFTIVTKQQADAVRVDLNRAAKLSVPNALNLPYIAACFSHRLYPQAEAALKQALERAPNDPQLLELLMEVYQLEKRPDDREIIRLRLRDIRARTGTISEDLKVEVP